MLRRKRQDSLFACHSRSRTRPARTWYQPMNEVEFGYRVRQALNEGVQRMDYKTTFRLEKVRKAALEKYRSTSPEVAWVRPLQVASGPQLESDQSGSWNWLRRLGLV